MKKIVWILLAYFVVLSSIPFLVEGLGWLEIFAFVPLFAFAEICENKEYGIKHSNLLTYLAFFLFNAATTFWIWCISPIGAIAALGLNSLQMFFIFWVFRKSKQVFSGAMPYIFFIAMWLAWERVYQNIEISWPWLILGNSLATCPKLAQWYEITGLLGGSLWVLSTSALLFNLIKNIATGSLDKFEKRKRAVLAAMSIVMIAVPMAASAIMYSKYEETSDPVEVVAVQPNIDSITEKHGGSSQDVQDSILLALAEPLVTPRTKYVITPETFSFQLQLDNPEGNGTYSHVMEFIARHPQVNFILGSLTYRFYPSKAQASPVASSVNGIWYDMFNTAILIDASGMRNYYHKSKLVSGVEIIPYQQYLPFLSKIISAFGGSSTSYARSNEVDNLETEEGEKVGVMICYESVYGDYYRQTALKGALFNAIITNDGWWGDTPGYRQHFRYAKLRSIENRRDVVHVANTGISGFINQRGDVLQKSGWWEPVAIKGEVNLNNEITFFTENGDIIGRVATFLFLLLLLGWVSKGISLKKNS